MPSLTTISNDDITREVAAVARAAQQRNRRLLRRDMLLRASVIVGFFVLWELSHPLIF
jgi:hypothetical protein